MPKQPSHKRNNQTLFTMWIEDHKREKWEEVRKQKDKPSLAKFVKEVVDEYIAKEEVKIVSNAETNLLRTELKSKYDEMNTIIAKMVEEFKKNTPVVPPPAETKSRILALLETVKRPVEWEEVVRIVGGDKSTVLASLEDLFKQQLVTMTNKGAWVLNE